MTAGLVGGGCQFDRIDNRMHPKGMRARRRVFSLHMRIEEEINKRQKKKRKTNLINDHSPFSKLRFLQTSSSAI